MSNVQNKKRRLSDAQIGGVLVGVGVVLGYYSLKHRANVKTGKMLMLAAETAVQEWVQENEKNGLSVILLPTKFTEELVTKKLLAIANSA